MAHLFRLIFLSFAVFCGSAHAVIPKSQSWSTTGSINFNNYGPFSGSGSTYQASCNAFLASASAGNSPYRVVLSSDGVSSSSCNWSVLNSSGSFMSGGYTYNTNNGLVCPANSTVSGSSCACNTGYVQDSTATSCVPYVDPCASLAGKSAGSVQWFAGPTGAYPTKPTYSYCDSYQSVGNGLCTATATKDICAGVDGQWICTGAASYSGVKAPSCTGDGSAPGTPSPITKPSDGSAAPVTPKIGEAAPAPCAPGMQAGSVNGVRVCAPYGVDTPTVSASPDSGTKTVTNADGTSTTTKINGVTTCAGNVCTTNTNTAVTNNNAAGAPTSTASSASNTSQSASSFCQDNSKSSQCTGQGDGKGGSFTGSCAAGFKADGDDAVLNAMAQEQFRLNCKILAADSAESVAINALLDSSGSTASVNPNDKTVNISSSSFDQTSALGSGSCNLNKTIVVAHMSATLPFNVLCDPLAVLGKLLVGVSLLLAARIVGRG